MKRKLFAIAAGLLLILPAACMHPGHRGGPGGPGCPKHQGCSCKCRQQPDCPQPDCPSRPDCPQQKAPAAPAN